MEAKSLSAISTSRLTTPTKISISACHLAKSLLGVKKMNGNMVPENEAVNFYALNQMVALLKLKHTEYEPLDDLGRKVVGAYLDKLHEQHAALVRYVFLVICRELRHLNNHPSEFAKPGYTHEFKSFWPNLQDTHSEEVLNKWLAKVPDQPLELFIQQITSAFNSPGKWSSGYGGKKWGHISGTLLKYVRGEISGEVFVDTAYTLAHNGGPMFNKNMIFETYDSNLLRILDVQRSGQICEGLIDGTFKHPDLLVVGEMAKSVKDRYEGIGDYIDWYKVEAMGAVNTYPNEKAKQDKLHPTKGPMIIDGKPVKVTGVFEVTEGESVMLFERMKAA